MNRTAAIIAMLAAAATASACAAGSGTRQPSAQRGLAFAQAHCAACHAVTANGISPNPESPPFEDVANMDGLTSATFSQFLIDSHNFPAAMNFTVQPAQARDLAAYMLTLRKPGHQPQE